MKVATVDEMRNLDAEAIRRYGITDDLLMENAGIAAFTVLEREFGIRGKRFAVVCGAGNNGGDGLVVARKIHSSGGHATVLILGDPERYRGAAERNYAIAMKLPVECTLIHGETNLCDALSSSDCIIDAIFGTGLTRDVSGMYAAAIAHMNASTKPVLSIDIPSGINGDSGSVMGTAIRASWTVTFGLPKIGNMLYPGYEHCGSVFVSHISFPPEMYTDQGTPSVYLNSHIPLPYRPRDAHKGSMGNVLVVAGAANYLGAPYFSAMSFLKAGGGYARLAAPRPITSFIAARGSEIVFLPQDYTDEGTLAIGNADTLLEISAKMDMVVVGPGISLNPETRQLARRLVADIPVPVLIDGDGLSAVAEEMDILKNRQGETIITPHPGEMSRLTGIDIASISENRVSVLRDFVAEYGVHTVLKGAHTLIGSPPGDIFINLSGNPGMASAGSGDVLTGTVAAMYGMGMPIRDSVRKGVFIHGLSGDLAAHENGEDGITADDILACLPRAVKLDRKGLPAALSEKYKGVRVI